MNSTEIGTIFLDPNHCIRLFTPAAAQMFNLLPQDIGRDIKHITYRVRGDDILHAIEEVGNSGTVAEINVAGPNGKSYLRRVKPYLDESRTIAGIVMTFVDVSDLISTQRQLRLSEFAVNNSSACTYWAEKDGRLIRANAAAGSLLGYSPETMLSMRVHEIHPWLSGTAWQTHWNELFERRQMRMETELRHRDGHVFPVEMDMNYFSFEGEEYWFVFVRDITERRRVERILARSEQLFRSTFRLATVGILLVTLDGQVAEANERFCNFLGYTADQIVNRSLFDIMHEDDRAAEEVLLAKARVRDLHEYEFDRRFVRRDGRIVWGQIHGTGAVVEGIDGSEPRLLRVVVDITDRRRIADALKESEDSLIEKETLLKEIHHRVKNNLQLISSLLRLQSDHFQDADQPALRECEQRVKAMALIHEKLYQAKSLARVDFAEYLGSLTTMLIHAYGTAHRVTIILDVPPVELTVDIAIPMALMLNELIANSLKHAFPGDRIGQIRIALHDDDGVGFPTDFRMEQSTSLGLHLVRILTDQLHARLAVGRSMGRTEFRVTFEQPIMTRRSFS